VDAPHHTLALVPDGNAVDGEPGTVGAKLSTVTVIGVPLTVLPALSLTRGVRRCLPSRAVTVFHVHVCCADAVYAVVIPHDCTPSIKSIHTIVNDGAPTVPEDVTDMADPQSTLPSVGETIAVVGVAAAEDTGAPIAPVSPAPPRRTASCSTRRRGSSK
jgi:hypothetical protein